MAAKKKARYKQPSSSESEEEIPRKKAKHSTNVAASQTEQSSQSGINELIIQILRSGSSDPNTLDK